MLGIEYGYYKAIELEVRGNSLLSGGLRAVLRILLAMRAIPPTV